MSEQTFHNILLMGRPQTAGVPDTLQALIDYLSEYTDTTLTIEENSADIIAKHGLPIASDDHLKKDIDLIIVVGGDGSLLSAAHLAIPHNIPVLGINRGRLGFLTDINPDDLDAVGKVIHGHYKEEKRFVLHTELMTNGKAEIEQLALNDTVLLPGDVAQMIEFETYVDNTFVYKQRADGLIVASPTGSTAYALSGGGPILHPSLDAMVLVPMFPHTLSSRPIVIDAKSTVEIHICEGNDTSPYMSCDGMERVAIPTGANLRINKHSQVLRLIHPENYSYYNTLRNKLGWQR